MVKPKECHLCNRILLVLLLQTSPLRQPLVNIYLVLFSFILLKIYILFHIFWHSQLNYLPILGRIATLPTQQTNVLCQRGYQERFTNLFDKTKCNSLDVLYLNLIWRHRKIKWFTAELLLSLVVCILTFFQQMEEYVHNLFQATSERLMTVIALKRLFPILAVLSIWGSSFSIEILFVDPFIMIFPKILRMRNAPVLKPFITRRFFSLRTLFGSQFSNSLISVTFP